jgi:hypothetical protein
VPFVLLAGAALDGTVTVPHPIPGPASREIAVKSAKLFTYSRGAVGALGVSEGMTDPVTGMIPMEESGVAYPDIYTIAAWRRPDWMTAVVALLFPVPLGLGLLALAFSSPGALVGAIPFLALGGWALYRALGIKRNFVRVAGRWRTIQIRFDKPPWRRKAFYDELLRRSGLPNVPIA